MRLEVVAPEKFSDVVGDGDVVRLGIDLGTAVLDFEGVKAVEEVGARTARLEGAAVADVQRGDGGTVAYCGRHCAEQAAVHFHGIVADVGAVVAPVEAAGRAEFGCGTGDGHGVFAVIAGRAVAKLRMSGIHQAGAADVDDHRVGGGVVCRRGGWPARGPEGRGIERAGRNRQRGGSRLAIGDGQLAEGDGAAGLVVAGGVNRGRRVLRPEGRIRGAEVVGPRTHVDGADASPSIQGASGDGGTVFQIQRPAASGTKSDIRIAPAAGQGQGARALDIKRGVARSARGQRAAEHELATGDRGEGAVGSAPIDVHVQRLDIGALIVGDVAAEGDGIAADDEGPGSGVEGDRSGRAAGAVVVQGKQGCADIGGAREDEVVAETIGRGGAPPVASV